MSKYVEVHEIIARMPRLTHEMQTKILDACERDSLFNRVAEQLGIDRKTIARIVRESRTKNTDPKQDSAFANYDQEKKENVEEKAFRYFEAGESNLFVLHKLGLSTEELQRLRQLYCQLAETDAERSLENVVEQSFQSETNRFSLSIIQDMAETKRGKLTKWELISCDLQSARLPGRIITHFYLHKFKGLHSHFSFLTRSDI